MSSSSNSEVVLSFFAEFKVYQMNTRSKLQANSYSHREKCAVQLTRRYILLLSLDEGQQIGKFLIPDILSVSPTPMDHGYGLKITVVIIYDFDLQCTSGSFLLFINDENSMKVFNSYLDEIMKTSQQVRLRTKEMIFARNNVDVIFDEGTDFQEDCADTQFADILSGLFQCKQPADLKHLLNRVQEYQNKMDISILALEKPQ